MARPQLSEDKRMSLEELLELPVMVDLETAGRAFGLGRTVSYELARSETFPCPVHRLGRYYRVRKAELMTSLGLGMDGSSLPAEPTAGAA